MSTVEAIEQFKNLPADERAKEFIALCAAFEQERDALKARLAEIKRVLNLEGVQQDQPAVPSKARYADDATFQEAKTWAFKEHDELLRKLSQ